MSPWDISAVLGGTRREIVEDLDWDSYLAAPALNPSTIAHGAKSMLHLKHAWSDEFSDSDEKQWGRAVHCLLFEPREFESRYFPWEGRRAGNKYSQLVQRAKAVGAEILTQARYDNALKAANRFVSDTKIQALVSAGKAEVTLFEVEGNIQCRGRVDWVSSSERKLVDLKTCKDISSRKFGRDFYAYGYDIKLGLYQRWLNSLTRCHWPVEVICLENSPPFDVALVPIPDAVLDRGVQKALDIIRRVELCIKADSWPGVSGGQDYPLYTPQWEMDDDLEGAEEVAYGE